MPEPVTGAELSDEQLNALQLYLSYLAPPAPRVASETARPAIEHGAMLFSSSGCVACHRGGIESRSGNSRLGRPVVPARLL